MNAWLYGALNENKESIYKPVSVKYADKIARKAHLYVSQQVFVYSII